MNPSQLWETTMDPAKRILKQINIEDVVAADKMFDILMGEVVEPAKNFIQSSCSYGEESGYLGIGVRIPILR